MGTGSALPEPGAPDHDLLIQDGNRIYSAANDAANDRAFPSSIVEHVRAMRHIITPTEMTAFADGSRAAGRRVALVPTMGDLHEGHIALIREADRRADDVIVSIFVNPTQFGPDEDFDRYPRRPESDRAILDGLGVVDVLFAPSSADLYPGGTEGQTIWVDTSALDKTLCGAYRPGHFRAVATVVAKLFNACRPHVAVFGLKDAQQYVVLRRMVEDLGFGIEMTGVPTRREPDGLAMSSRNRYLTDAHRAQAVVLSRAVEKAAEVIEKGESDPSVAESAMRQVLAEAPDASVQYASVVDAETLQAVGQIRPGREVLAAVAVFFGGTRLIDNAFVRPAS